MTGVQTCALPISSLQALIDAKKPPQTAIGLFVDKEEIGSVGNTGAASLIVENFMYEYAQLTGQKELISTIFERSMAISADVTAGINPTYKDVNDVQNGAVIGSGIAIEKYTGAGGKYSANDAHAEYVSFLRQLMKKGNIPHQFGEIGKVDEGGGGTIALFMSRYGLDIIDAGPAVLGMHSPFEVLSKADFYSAYLLYKAFFEH